MIAKTIFMFALFFVPYALMYVPAFSSPIPFIGLWILMGLGMAGIGLTIMHDAIHGAYSSKRKINRYLGYSMNIIGANAEIWKLQHNELHHVYTNIQGADDDIDTPSFLRFSPFKELKWIHRFQYVYVWFFYALSTLFWVTSKEFVQLFKYRDLGIIKSRIKFKSILRQLILWKVIYYLYVMLIPMFFMPVPAWQIFLGFLSMHLVAGFILSLIFQTAHVMPLCEYQLAEEDSVVQDDWAVHEMKTTNNYAPGSRIFSWLVGGLNFQIEHHLFPQICHVHYKNISKIVASTAQEFDIAYNSQKTFAEAIRMHTRMLYQLGRVEPKSLAHT